MINFCEGVGIVIFTALVFVTDESLTDLPVGRLGRLGDVEEGLEDGVYFSVASIFHEKDFLFCPWNFIIERSSKIWISRRLWGGFREE